MYSYTLRKHLVVAGVLPGGPGETAGLKAGDVVLAIDDQEVSDGRLISTAVEPAAGETVLFRISATTRCRRSDRVGECEEFFA